MNQAVRDAGRNKCNFCLGFCSVFIVVISILLINTLTGQGPIIFITIAQGFSGQIDAIMVPTQDTAINGRVSTFGTNGVFFNYTQAQEISPEPNLTPRK